MTPYGNKLVRASTRARRHGPGLTISWMSRRVFVD